MNKEKDITGNKYGRLTAVKRYGSTKDSHPIWLFRCECGNSHIARKNAVTTGLTSSCGKCLPKNPPIIKTHDMSNTRIYRIWASMKNRCKKQCISHRSRYYDRGIKVCDEWQCFEPFYEWAITNGYKEDLTIDRIDNNKGYSPDNCRWTTPFMQARNKRNNVFVPYKGETHCLADWEKITGIDQRILGHRLKVGDRDDVLFRPVGAKKCQECL